MRAELVEKSLECITRNANEFIEKSLTCKLPNHIYDKLVVL